MTPVVVSSVTPLMPWPMRVQYWPSSASVPRSTSRMTPYSSESASVVSGTAPSASKRVPRCTSSVASPPSSRSMLGPTTSPESSRNSKRRCVHHQYSSSVSPFQANTGTPVGCSGVPSPTTIAAAAWSCVEKMLQLTQRTSAPSAVRVSMSTAVCTVMCSEPAMRAPASGCSAPYSSRRETRPGISCSASWISLRPKPARERSATLKSPSVSTRVPVLAVMSLQCPAGLERAAGIGWSERACRGFGGARAVPRVRRPGLLALEQLRPGVAAGQLRQPRPVLLPNAPALAHQPPEDLAPAAREVAHRVPVEPADTDSFLRGIGHDRGGEQRDVPPVRVGGGDRGGAPEPAQQLPEDPLGQHRPQHRRRALVRHLRHLRGRH